MQHCGKLQPAAAKVVPLYIDIGHSLSCIYVLSFVLVCLFIVCLLYVCLLCLFVFALVEVDGTL